MAVCVASITSSRKAPLELTAFEITVKLQTSSQQNIVPYWKKGDSIIE
jgi:hypothetical protein